MYLEGVAQALQAAGSRQRWQRGGPPVSSSENPQLHAPGYESDVLHIGAKGRGAATPVFMHIPDCSPSSSLPHTGRMIHVVCNNVQNYAHTHSFRR
jgi:hypothetical protein